MNLESNISGGKQRLSPQHFPWMGFSIALLILLLIAIAADRATSRLEDTQAQVNHTQEVERLLLRLRGDFLAAQSSRLLYVVSGDPKRLDAYYTGAQRVPADLDMLGKLAADSADQQARLRRLRSVINQALGTLKESVDLRKVGADGGRQDALTISGTALGNQAMDIINEMRDEEDALLLQRQSVSRDTYGNVRFVLAVAFCVAAIMLAASFHRLRTELRERSQAEDAVRRLNARIVQVQDAERRKVARELHDGIGQVLTALKLDLSMFANEELTPERKAQLVDETRKLVDQGIMEARTLSHLLHPPLLDELGFSSAAKWLVDGFSERSGIRVNLQIPAGLRRLPPEVELALFRVLQESLTNIHRHSESSSAEIRLESTPGSVKMTVRDYGKGIPAATVEKFRRNAGIGVGLSGMRERVSEMNGSIELWPGEPGTVVQVKIPVPQTPESDRNAPETSHPEKASRRHSVKSSGGSLRRADPS